MFSQFLSFRIKEHAKKVYRKRYKKYLRLKARNFDRSPSIKQIWNFLKYGDTMTVFLLNLLKQLIVNSVPLEVLSQNMSAVSL